MLRLTTGRQSRSADDASEASQLQFIPPETITVAIFCALPYEAVAVRYCLDEEFSCRLTTVGPRNYLYTFGRIGGIKIVIARPHQMGTVNAAHCATAVNNQFPNVVCCLMVGIGAGIPNLPQHDIRLGDIVVSVPQDGHPGVIQYDFGKYEEDGFVLKGSLNKPPPILLSADGKLVEEEMMDRSPLETILQHITNRRGFNRPNIEDILFDPSFSHTDQGEGCLKCKEMGGTRLAREARYYPVVHRGLILSGSGVIKNPVDRERLRRGYKNALCYEMEAAGIMDEIPCLVIRGICDYADTHKQDGWHHYAAAAAAAYCKAILCKVDIQRHVISYISNANVEGKLTARSTNLADFAEQKVIDISKLPIAEDAHFGSYADQHEVECLEGTRTDLLREIEDWVDDSQGKCIFWLSGMAGTGKSTVSRTVARKLVDKGLLGASFFFKRDEGDRGSTKRYFPTIVRQLIDTIPQLKPGLAESLEKYPDIASSSLQEQFDKLLLQPLLTATNPDTPVTHIVIVTDALDECDRDEDIAIILQLLPKVRLLQSARLRFFLTSRPQHKIKQSLENISALHQDLVLHEILEMVLERDISLYLEDQFSKMRQQHSFPADWPGPEIIRSLVLRSIPLFIAAATLCKFINDEKWIIEKRLKAILSDHTVYASKFRATYMPVLNQLLTGQDEWESQQLVQEFKDLVGVLIVLTDALPIQALSGLLHMEADEIKHRLNFLHSVLDVPNNLERPVRLLHASFRDFLLDWRMKDKNPFWIDERRVHDKLTLQCLDVMHHKLRRNICCLPDDSTKREEIDARSITQYVEAEVRYACRYWAHHLMRCRDPSSMLGDAFSFLKDHILHWMEVMGILGLISEAMAMIDSLNRTMPRNHRPKISAFMHDAKRFIMKNRSLAEIVPLQLYSSGLIFAPRTSLIRRRFENELPELIYRYPRVQEMWSADLQTLDNEYIVQAMSFSPEKQLLATGAAQGAIKVWDMTTGALRLTITAHKEDVHSVAFSPDGRLLVSGSYDQTIKLWDTDTGALQRVFYGHTGGILAVAISSSLVISSSSDNTIKLWDAATGILQHTLQFPEYVQSLTLSPDEQSLILGHSDGTITIWGTDYKSPKRKIWGNISTISTVAISPCGQLLVSSSYSGTIRLWDFATGTLKREFPRSEFSSAVAFSPDSQFLAIERVQNSQHTTIDTWNMKTGKQEHSLNYHADNISSMAFIGQQQLVTGSYDGTVTIWEVTGGPQEPIETQLNPTRILKFSIDGRFLVSISRDETIKLWDPATEEVQTIYPGYKSKILSVAVSSDGQLLATSLVDETIKIWNITTNSLQRNLITLPGSNDSIFWIWVAAFSPDNRLLVSISRPSTIYLWNVVTGAQEYAVTLDGKLTEVKFSATGPYLETNLGKIYIETWYNHSASSQSGAKMGRLSLIEERWVALNGRRILWLPPEYQVNKVAICNDLIAIPRGSGRVYFIGFRI